jgi:hypothetical protein
MKIFPIIILLSTLLFSCTKILSREEKNSILISSDWKLNTTGNEQSPSGIHTFKSNGLFVEDVSKATNAQPILMSGTWKWLNDDEISIVYTTMAVKGNKYDIGAEEKNSYIIRITEITNDGFKGIKRFSKDSEKSGAVQEVSYSRFPD